MSTICLSEWEEFALIRPDATTTESSSGESLVSLPSVALTSGWGLSEASVYFVLPVGYPAAQPDCFWTSSDLRLESGDMPANAALQQIPILEQPGLWFSWHVASWRPGHDTVTTYWRFVISRLRDAR